MYSFEPAWYRVHSCIFVYHFLVGSTIDKVGGLETLIPELGAFRNGVLVQFPECLRSQLSVVRHSVWEHVCTFICRLYFLLTSCMNRYISVALGFGCSQSFLGTTRESILTEGRKWPNSNNERKENRYEERMCRRELTQLRSVDLHQNRIMRGRSPSARDHGV